MSDTKGSGQHGEKRIAALDFDQGEWCLAISDGGPPDFSVQPDAGEVQKTVGGFPVVVATEECRSQLRRSAPELRPRFVRRLQAIARCVPQAGDGGLILWMSRYSAACARMEGLQLAGEQVDCPKFSPRGLFEHYADTVGSLKAWTATRKDSPDELARVFDSFLANLKNGTTNKVGPTSWMRDFQRLPKEFVDEGVRRGLAVVDPERLADKLVLAGWARVSHWDLGELLARELPGISILRPACATFSESLTGLIEDELARQGRPPMAAAPHATGFEPPSAPRNEPPIVPTASAAQVSPPALAPVAQPLQPSPAAPPSAPKAQPAATAPKAEPPQPFPATPSSAPKAQPAATTPKAEPPQPSPAAPPPAPKAQPAATAPKAEPLQPSPAAPPPAPKAQPAATALPRPQPPPATHPRPPAAAPVDGAAQAPDVRLDEAQHLCEGPMARTAQAVAGLVESLGRRAAGPRVTLDAYLQVAKSCSSVAGGDSSAIDGLRKSLETLEKNQKEQAAARKDYRWGFFELLDCETPEDKGTTVADRAAALRELAGIEAIVPELGVERTKTDDVQVLTPRGQGRWATITKVHSCGYMVDGVAARKPRVDVQRSRKSSHQRAPWMKEHWPVLAGAMALLLSIVFLMHRLTERPPEYERVGLVDAGEPVVSLWGVPGTPLVVALTGAAGAERCHLRIWRAPAWDAPSVLPAPCGPAAVSQDGQYAAWGSPDNLPTVTRVSDNVVILNMNPYERRHSTPLTALAFSGDGKVLYSASKDGAVREWDTGSGSYIKDLSATSSRPVRSLLVADSFVAVGEANSPVRVRIWPPQCSDPVLLEGASAEIATLAFDGETRMIVGGAADGEVLGWDWEGQSCGAASQPVWRRRPMDKRVQSILPAGGSRVYVSYSETVYAWRYGGNQIEDDGDSLDPKNPISGAALVNSGESTLLVTADDRNVRFWRISR